MDQALKIIQKITSDTEYQNKLYLVGGIVRDEILGVPPNDDIDIVLEDDAIEFAHFLYEKGASSHYPVTYPRFGTAMITVDGKKIEIVGARRESYDHSSRKPDTVPGSLRDDVFRRDFTINTLLKNLHTSEILDLTGFGFSDLKAGIIRTPLDPLITFDDDPLRMLRAVRFSARFNFQIQPQVFKAIQKRAERLSIISGERIRDEFVKIITGPNPVFGLDILRKTELLKCFAPELVDMYDVTQNDYHIYDVWKHSLKVLENLPKDSSDVLKIAALFHDIGKPLTKTIDVNGNVHFYKHQNVGADITTQVMRRLRFSNSEIEEVAFLIQMHLRVGEYDDVWSDSAVRRLIRDTGARLEDLIALTIADKESSNLNMPSVDIDKLKEHIALIKKQLPGKIQSPLNGNEILEILPNICGEEIGKLKAFLENEVIEGNLQPTDKEKASQMIKNKYA